MGESVKRSDLEEILKPFYQRASESEERLSRLEAVLANVGNEDHLRLISELQSQLQEASAELVSEREKAQKLAEENAKLQYRIIHLVRAAKEADLKLESKS
ncbi:uncharacterized protein LOC132161821 isoform X2 [Corylus avellana]|uniref:uncharacterized protein LOC132161821 isoform X2 n=1 Tax=Corylus avellana TaxID=13451 RepID=UPI00286D46C9|nr:uncharacterized protein LOC132161821 isoform X2 [Corylus avellana]